MKSTFLKVLPLRLLPAIALLAGPAAAAPPLLPATASFDNLSIAADSVREFDVDLPRTERWLAWELSSADPGALLSGTVSFAAVNGQLLSERALDGLSVTGGVVPAPPGTAGRRIRVTLRGGAAAMRANLALLPNVPQLKSGQVVPVFARNAGSEAFSGAFDLKLSKPADVDVVTWGGDAAATLTVSGEAAAPACDDRGDGWRRCVLPALGAGTYRVTLAGTGSPLNLSATWKVIEQP